MNDELQNLLETNILDILELQDASPAAQQRALKDANDRILREVIQRIRARLSPELKNEFERLFATENDTIAAEDTAFLKKHVPDFGELLIEETLKFKKGVMIAVEDLKQKSADESEQVKNILNGLGNGSSGNL